MPFWRRRSNPAPSDRKNQTNPALRVIKTARDLDEINAAVADGYTAVFRKVEPMPEIRSKYTIVRNRSTGKFEAFGDYRLVYNDAEQYETVIDWTHYYPYMFDAPFAAYLIPKDIRVGERVMLEDLIEDYVGASWNQGEKYRLGSCEAIWNGQDLVVQYDANKSVTYMIG